MIALASLSDPPAQSVITPAALWLESLMFGTIASIIAALAIASIGLAMLTGRIPTRRGLAIILGCFILFGAKSVADGMKAALPGAASTQRAEVPPPPTYVKPPIQQPAPASFDPYAGASVPTRQ